MHAMNAPMGTAVTRPSADAALSAITAAALAAVPTATYAGINCPGEHGHRRTYGSTDILVDTLDLLQETFQQGPCMDTAAAVVTTIADIATVACWPRFITAAGRLGVSSILVHPLIREKTVRGVLILYATTAGAFTVDDEAAAAVLAADAAAVLAADEVITNLQSRNMGVDYL